MSDYDRLALKLEAMEFSGVPVGVLINDAALPKVLGVHTSFVFQASRAGEGAQLISLVDLYADQGPYRSLAIGVDKDKDLTRAVVAWALSVLPSCGQLVLVGEKRLGVQSFEKLLSGKMEGVIKLPMKDLGRLSFWTQNQPPEAAAPIESLWTQNKISVGPVELTLHALPGVFASGQLDAGSALLIEAIDLPAEGKFLDLACGGGVIGAWAKKKSPALAVTLTDDDANAIASTRRTFEENKLKAENIFCADGTSALPAGQKFDVIALNPPFHQGQSVSYITAERLIAEAAKLLAPGGQLYIVANRFCPYERTLNQLFPAFQQLRETSSFKVLKAIQK